jgi:hypothetical protein
MHSSELANSALFQYGGSTRTGAAAAERSAQRTIRQTLQRVRRLILVTTAFPFASHSQQRKQPRGFELQCVVARWFAEHKCRYRAPEAYASH